MNNLLENWKKECDVLSSQLNLRKILERRDVDNTYRIISEFFGKENFDINTNERSTIQKSNWLYYLLINYKRKSCIAAIFEIAHLIKYLQTLDNSVSKKFYDNVHVPHQVRALFFELYILRLLDYNRIPNLKNCIDVNQPLDAVCTINKKEFLCECKKSFLPNLDELDIKQYLLVEFYLEVRKVKKGFGMIGCIKINDFNKKGVKGIFRKKIAKFCKAVQQQNFSSINYHDVDENGKFIVVDYSLINNLEIEKDKSQYDILLKIIPPQNPIPDVPNLYNVEFGTRFSITEKDMYKKFIEDLKWKRKQHKNSKFEHKIYFFDNETIPDFNMPVFQFETITDPDKFLSFLNEKEIVCIIFRDYSGDLPKTKIRAYGKNIDEKIRNTLENLKTDFGYKIASVSQNVSTLT